MFLDYILTFPAPKPEKLSCSATNSSVDITWQVPDTRCEITGFEVNWGYSILWNSYQSTPANEILGVEDTFSIEDTIPYSDYSVEVSTLVVDFSGVEYASCSVTTPEESKPKSYFCPL